MTNDLKISRELAQQVDDLLYIMTGHDSYPRMVHKYGKDWWSAVDEMRNGLCTALAAPVLERQDPVAYLRQSDLVRLNQPHVSGCAASLSKEPTTGFIAIYTSPPAPVAVRLPEGSNERDHAGDFTYEAKAWNACLDKVKELNH